MKPNTTLSRRELLSMFLTAATVRLEALRAEDTEFRLKYILASALFGMMDLGVILPEVRKTGAEHIDIWCLKHGNQREQIDSMGMDAFAALLAKHDVKLGAVTRYPLGPFGLQDEMKVLQKLGGRVIVTGSNGPKGLSGDALKTAVQEFVEKMKPHARAAEALGVTIAIENHSGSLLSSVDSMRYFAEFNRSHNLGVAFAPHHLHDAVEHMPKLIEYLGRNVVFFYAQEHGGGFTEMLPKDKEMMQLPGFGGGLDYRPLLAALKKINYQGFVEIFMHPTPRGIPILPTATEITAAVNKSRSYLESCIR